ncbi:MAG TPA: PAS domain S-box protein, partial [Luteibaculaceae bacterium]|nr:PAS domain S-box protein [Luteibaculaceae bacterium]
IVGYTQDELRHLTFQDITHPEDLASDLALLKKLVQGKIQNYQLYKRYFHKQGHIVHILLGVSAVRKENGEILHFVSQIIDVSDQQRSKLLLEQELQRNERILNASTHVGIISTDKRGLISSFNRGAENLLGCSSAQVLHQKHLIEFFDPKELEDRKALHELQYAQFINPFELLILSTNKQNASAGIWTVQTKQGHSFPVQISIAPIEVDQQVTGYLVIATDFTELKSAQEKVLSLLERSNEQNEKLRGFTQMVSHNLRSHSANMEQLVQILVEDFPSIRESETYHYLHKLVGDFAHTIENLHHIALVNAFKPSEAVTVPLAPLINEVISEHRDLIEEAGMDVKLELKGKAKAKGDPSFLRYIFGQLISNAITFRDTEKQSVLIIKVNKESGGLMLEIIDNGIGFDMAKNEKKLFGLFKVFHKESKGKGLGLFLVKNMIEVMGGKIHVSSQVNKGTIFNILLENG